MDHTSVVAGTYRDDGVGGLLDALALYVPSWGSSVVLHLAVLVLAAFLVWTRPPEPLVTPVEGGVVVQHRPRVDVRPKPTEGVDSRGHAVLRPSTFAQQFTTNPFPDVASNNLDPVKVIGPGAGGSRVGGFEGLDNDPGGRLDFFQIVDVWPDEGPRKVVYVVDRSGSMNDSLQYVKNELRRSLREMAPGYQFHIVFYSSGLPLEMPARRLVSATEENKRRAFAFIDDVTAQGDTDPSEALRLAFAVKPDVIFLLTDGEFDQVIVDQVAKANVGKKVTVHTLAFLYPRGEKVLQEIARQNGGTYRFVTEADLPEP